MKRFSFGRLYSSSAGENGGGSAVINEYYARSGAKRVPAGFSYNSGSNPDFLTVKQIRDLIRTHVKSDFQA